MNLWPRLPVPRARAIASRFEGTSPTEVAATAGDDIPLLFAPTGGVPVQSAVLLALKAQLEGIANANGYPQRPTLTARRGFDANALRLVAESRIPFGEAIRPEVWAYITVALVPHLVQWRWGLISKEFPLERWAGPLVRNALGRLWYQATLLDRGSPEDRWLYSDSLGADQAVSLLERPRLAANRIVCTAVARHWAGMAADDQLEDVFREAMKSLVVQDELRRLDALEATELSDVVAASFGRALIAVKARRARGGPGAATIEA